MKVDCFKPTGGEYMQNKFMDNPWRMFNVLAARGMFDWLPDKPYLQLRYRAAFNRRLNFSAPQTFNEKLQWIKVHDRKPDYTVMVDKYLAKRYVAEKLGEKYIIPTFGIWETFNDIVFEELPYQFVLKCTHDSGGLLICKNKKELELIAAERKMKKSLKSRYFKWGREWPYKDVQPRIMAEQYLSNNGGDVVDYKVHCFNGIPRLILICTDRFSRSGLREDFFDVEWNHLNLSRPNHPNSNFPLSEPACLHEMLELSKILSKGVPFLRTDFYEVSGKLFFGELTFFPASGLQPFQPDEWDYKMGKWIEL